MINVYIVSGFLGSGKTTFIRKLLSEKSFEKVMLLENEFGEVGVDGAFFDSNLKVQEINNGCICCSLQGDFESALKDIEAMGISDLIVEPSGVGKLSEIINVIKNDEDFRIVSHICIVDVKTCQKYHANFGEYFNDQVTSANAVILSHTDVADDAKIEKAVEIVRELNDDADIVTTPVSEMSISELLDIIVKNGEICFECLEEHHHHHHHHDDEECCCGHHHHHEDDDDCCCGHHHHEDDDECCCEHHHHDDEDCCCHDHEHHHDHDDDDHDHEHHHHHHHGHHHHDHDDEVFKNAIYRPDYIFSEDELKNILSSLSDDIIRAKGYVKGEKGTLYFNYILNESTVYYGENREDALVSVIGTVVDRNALKEAFHG